MRELRHDMRREAEALLSRFTNLSDPTRKILAALFKITLPQDPEHRAENFSEILQLFDQQK
jgi:hypothetical protein